VRERESKRERKSKRERERVCVCPSSGRVTDVTHTSPPVNERQQERARERMCVGEWERECAIGRGSD